MAYLTDKKQKISNSNKPVSVNVKTPDNLKAPAILAINVSDALEKHDNEILLNFTDDLLWSVNCDIKLINFNSAFTAYLKNSSGITPTPGDELLTNPVFMELGAFWASSYKRALAGEFFKEEIYTPALNNGKAVWTETVFNPIKKAGLISGVVCCSKNITEKKLTEEKLKEAETRLVQTQEVSKVGSWVTDLSTLEVIWSQETYNIFELDSTSFKASHPDFLEFVHPDDRAKVDAAFLNSINGDSINTLEHRVRTTTGAIKIVEERWRIFRNNEGKPVRAVGTCQDITERKKIKAALQKAYGEKNTVLQRIDDGFFALDENSIVTYWNKRAEILLDTKKEDVIGKNLHEVFWLRGSGIFYHHYLKAINEKITIHFQGYSNLSKKWFDVSAYGSENGLSVYFKDVTDQKDAEEKIKESELRYRSLIEQATDTICIVDTFFKFIEVNSSGCLMFGCTKEEVLQLSMTDVLFKEDLTINPLRIEDLKAGKSISNERRIRRKDGSAILVELSSKMQEDGSIIIFGRDISERKESERLVRESEAKFRSFFESSMDGILLTVTDGEILAANPAACEIFNMTEAEICAAGRFGLVDITDPRLYFLLEERKKTGKAKGELTLLRKDGGTFEAELTSAVFTDSYGRKRTSMIVRDISERKEAEFKLSQTSRELRHTLNDLNKIMDSSQDVICAVDANGYFVKVSAASESVWGYKPNELIGKPVIDFVYSEDREKTQNTAADVMWGINATCFENRYIRKDGSVVPMEWTASWDEKDQLRYGVARDVTEKKKLEKANEIERQRFMGLYLHAPSCMGILKGPNYVFELANPLYLQLVNKSDIIGKTVKEVFPEMTGQGLLELLDAVYKTGNTFSANERLVQMDLNGNGELVDTYLNFIYQAHRNHVGDIDGIVFFVNDVTEQVLSRRKIEESEKRYRQIVETAQEGIWMIDENNKTTFVNRKMCEILEYTGEEMMGKTIFSFMDEAGKKLAGELMVKKMQGHVGHEHFKYLTKSGKEVWTNISTNPLFSEEGTYTGSLAMVTDITEKKQAEIQLKESNERYNLISRATNDMVWDWNLVTGKVYRNKEGWKKIFRTGDHEIENELTCDWNNRIHPEDRAKVKEVNDEIKNSEKNFFEVECRMLRDDGTYAHIHDRGNILRNKQGKAIRLIGATQDITARKEAELQVVKSELHFRSLVQNGSDLISILDQTTRYLYSSPASKRVLGYEPEYMIGKTAFSFIHPDDTRLLIAYIEKIKSGNNIKVTPFRFKNASGTWTWLESKITDLRDNPEVQGYVVNSRDVTDRILLEKELEEERLLKHQEITQAVISAQERERQELGGELHDNVNQILAGSLLYLGLAKKELNIDNEYLKETYTLINNAIVEIRNLSHSLIPPSLHESAFLEALKNIIEGTQKTSGIIISLQAGDFDEGSITDKLKLTIYRIVQEQINNILKHAAAQKVIVHLENDNEKTLLSIQDDGIGFDTSKKANGVGLLNIKTRASLFNGEVSVISSPGNGCEVRVLFN